MTPRLEIEFDNGRVEFISISSLEIVDQNEDEDIYTLLNKRHFGAVDNLRSAMTHARLSGRLSDIIYSMETSNTDYYPYQYKPVLNFFSTPVDGLLIADEVGLGKTIEAGLIWTEMRARFDANRLLVIAPAVLQEKWRDELVSRFGLDAQIYNAGDLLALLKRASTQPNAGFCAIASLQGLRPPKSGKRNTDTVITRSKSAELLDHITSTYDGRTLFDLVIVDEAHYLRNPNTQSNKLIRSLRPYIGKLLLLSATPLQTASADLFHLLNLIDDTHFDHETSFARILRANEPIIRLTNALRRGPMNNTDFSLHMIDCLSQPELHQNRQLKQLFDAAESLDLDSALSREKIATTVERANLLAHVVNRTRKRDVIENRTVRQVTAPTVEMTSTETMFYQSVTDSVRRYCFKADTHEGLIVTIPQRQMCSSIPAAFRAWSNKQNLLDNEELYDTGLSVEGNEGSSAGALIRHLNTEVSKIATYEVLREEDSKYRVLLDELSKYLNIHPNNKIIIFSYYKETIRYLEERLNEDGIRSIKLYGGMKIPKHEIIAKFKDSKDCRVLIASEVASEGIDLQFCSFLINYDLPWNPMKVEQRIGRIDRIGQTAPKILVQNLFYAKTLDDRVYWRLYQRLRLFEQSLGDMESILGERIKSLTVDLLRHDLTEMDEIEKIEQTRMAIAQKIRQQEELEQEATHLAAHGDFILNQVKAAREMQRYIDGSDIKTYVIDYVNRHYKGSIFIRDDENEYLYTVSLSTELKNDLHEFLRKNRIEHNTRLVSSMVHDPVKCLFSNKPCLTRDKVEVIHYHHPLTRFIRSKHEYNIRYPLVAARVSSQFINEVPKGLYIFISQLWTADGHRTEEKIMHFARNLDTAKDLSAKQAESLVSAAYRHGTTEDRLTRTLDVDMADEALANIEDRIDKEFNEYASQRKAENEDRIDLLVTSLKERKTIEVDRKKDTIKNLKEEGKTKTIPAHLGQLKKIESHFYRKIAELERQRKMSISNTGISSGLIVVK